MKLAIAIVLAVSSLAITQRDVVCMGTGCPPLLPPHYVGPPQTVR